MLTEFRDNMICVFRPHVISDNDQNELLYFGGPIRTMCVRCKYPLTIWVKDEDEDNFYYQEDY